MTHLIWGTRAEKSSPMLPEPGKRRSVAAGGRFHPRAWVATRDLRCAEVSYLSSLASFLSSEFALPFGSSSAGFVFFFSPVRGLAAVTLTELAQSPACLALA